MLLLIAARYLDWHFVHFSEENNILVGNFSLQLVGCVTLAVNTNVCSLALPNSQEMTES